MTVDTTVSTRMRARRTAAMALACGAAAFWLAAPAQARGGFAEGFEDQLGRLAAFEVFRTGRALIYHATVPGWDVQSVRPLRPRRARPHRHFRERCDVRIVESVTRDRRGRLVRTLREERCCDDRRRGRRRD